MTTTEPGPEKQAADALPEAVVPRRGRWRWRLGGLAAVSVLVAAVGASAAGINSLSSDRVAGPPDENRRDRCSRPFSAITVVCLLGLAVVNSKTKR